MMFTKFIVVVDEHVDVHDYSEVTWRVFNNVDPHRDSSSSTGPLDVLDHSSPPARYGTKMGIDATKTWPEEGHAREWPDELAMDPDVKRRVNERWTELGLPFAEGRGRSDRFTSALLASTLAVATARRSDEEAAVLHGNIHRHLLILSLANWAVAIVCWTISAYLGIASPTEHLHLHGALRRRPVRRRSSPSAATCLPTSARSRFAWPRPPAGRRPGRQALRQLWRDNAGDGRPGPASRSGRPGAKRPADMPAESRSAGAGRPRRRRAAQALSPGSSRSNTASTRCPSPTPAPSSPPPACPPGHSWSGSPSPWSARAAPPWRSTGSSTPRWTRTIRGRPSANFPRGSWVAARSGCSRSRR